MISVILNVYKRPYTLESQIESILNQSVEIKPENIHVWYNPVMGIEQPNPKDSRIKTYRSSWNTKFFGRFTIPLMCRTKYIAMFDDDVIAGLKSTVPTEVDLVGHAWFFKQEHSKYMWTEEPPSWDNGEDMFFSYVAKKHGIPTIVPPHDPNNVALWSNDPSKDNGWGYDINAHSLTHNNHITLRNQIVSTLIDKGWKTVKMRNS